MDLGLYRTQTTSETMRFHGESVLDASLAFLDEIDELPDLPDMANHLEAALIDPTEMMLNELLGLANADEGNARIPDPSATTIVMSVKEETGKPIKTRKKGSKPIGMGTKAARKQEIEFLRTQVQELEGELSRLQKGLVPSTEPTLWERITKRQRDVRKQHEAENTELRVLYQGQLKVARGLVRLLHRGQADMSSAWGNVKRRRIIEADEHSGQIFQSIRNSLVARLVPVDNGWKRADLLASTTLLTTRACVVGPRMISFWKYCSVVVSHFHSRQLSKLCGITCVPLLSSWRRLFMVQLNDLICTS